METYEQKNPKTYPVYKDFVFPRDKTNPKLKEILNDSLYKIYGFKNGGRSIIKAFSQLKWFMRIFKYDYWGIKQKVFDLLDTIAEGTASFSYHRYITDAKLFLNENHKPWRNPISGEYSDKSFMDLFNKALIDTAKIINRLEKNFEDGVIDKTDICDIIPDIASTHGLKCGQHLKINYTKQ